MSHITDKSGTVRIRKGTAVTMVGGQYESPSDASVFNINNDDIQRHLKPNDVAYIDDGKVVAVVTGINEKGIQLEVKIGGAIKSRSTVRFTQGKHANLQVITQEDINDLSAIS